MPVDIGRTIRVLRQAKGLQLKEVAASAAISNPFLTLVEKGERSPSLAVIRRIANALKVPVEALIMLSHPGDTGFSTTNELAQRIVSSIQRLSLAEENLRRQLEGQEDGNTGLLESDP
jgi:transcriptional regulator with XRE-family HTH domain